MSTVVPTRCQREIRQLLVATLQPGCPPLTACGARRQLVQQPGIILLPLGTYRFLHQRYHGPAGERLHACSPSPSRREAPRLLPTGPLRWQGGCAGAALRAGQRGRAPCPCLSLHHVGRDRVGARQVGTGPRCCSALAVHPTRGSRCLLWAELPLGLTLLLSPGALSAGIWCLCPAGSKAPSKRSPMGNVGGDGIAGAGTLPGDAPSLNGFLGTGRRAVRTRAAVQGLCF